MASRKGTPREIATQGLSSPDGLGIATQGFIEPILGDLILGGCAEVNYRPVSLILGGCAEVIRGYVIVGDGGLITGGDGTVTASYCILGEGGLITGGAADIVYSVMPTVGGDVVLGGAATVTQLFNIIPQGGLITDGAGNVNVSYCILGEGGLVTDGEAGTVLVPGGIVGEGGLILGGCATVDANIGPIEFGRGGARIPPRRRQPTTVFEPPVWDPADYLEPMDYLKKIQDVLDQAEKDKLNILKYLAKGTVQISGRGKVVAIIRDKPDGKMIVADCPPLEPIVLELPHVFNKGISAREMAEMEDRFLLNDMLGLGDYTIKTGPKARYIHQSRKTTSGSAGVNFVSGKSAVTHFNMKEHRQRDEDEEFLLEVNLRSRQDQEEEDLRMLGIID